jgi:hypothetical protein
MFRITYFNDDIGDIASVHVADNFEAAVQDILKNIGTSPNYKVEVNSNFGSDNLQVLQNEIVIASIDDYELLINETKNLEVINACLALRQGDEGLILKLFQP